MSPARRRAATDQGLDDPLRLQTSCFKLGGVSDRVGVLEAHGIARKRDQVKGIQQPQEPGADPAGGAADGHGRVVL